MELHNQPKVVKFIYAQLLTGVADETGNVTAISYTENTGKIKREEALRSVFAFLMFGIDLSAMEALEQYRNREEDADIIRCHPLFHLLLCRAD